MKDFHLGDHSVFRRLLQVGIQRQAHAISCHRRCPRHIADRLARRIDLYGLHARLAFQVFVVLVLQSRAADELRRGVRIAIGIPVIRPRFTHIAQHLSPGDAEGILPERIHFDFDAREFVLLLLDFRGHIDAHIIGQINGTKGQLIVLDFLLDVSRGHMEKRRKLRQRLVRERIPLAVQRHDDAVSRARTRHDDAIAIIHDAAIRLHREVTDAISIGLLFVIVPLDHLHEKEASPQDEEKNHGRINHAGIARLLRIFQKP